MDLRNLPLATTPAGRNFVIKSLHPADYEIKTNRVPGGTVPTVAVSMDVLETIPFPATSTRCLIMQTPNILFPASLAFFAADGSYVDHYILCNPSFAANSAYGGWRHAPSSHMSLTNTFENFTDVVDSWRVTAQSLTCDVIAPATASQGTILSAQLSDRPKTGSPAWYSAGSSAAGVTPITSHWNGADTWCYFRPPAAGQYLMATSAYTAKAVDGFYQPLKLGMFKWRASADNVMFYQDIADEGSDVSYSSQFPTTMPNYPIYFNNLTVNLQAQGFQKMSSYQVGMTWIDGVASGAVVSLRLRARQIVEIMPVLGATYAPLAEAPFPPDDTALRMVVEIAGRMRDAYPASYNDLGTLKKTIRDIGATVLKYANPVLDVMSAIPGLGTATTVARNAVGIGRAVAQLAAKRSNSSGSKGKKKAPPQTKPSEQPAPTRRTKLRIVRPAQK